MVTNKELVPRLEKLSEERLAIVRAKNSNYAGGSGDSNAFKNFDMIEVLTNGKVSREVGMLVRMTDKLARLATLITGTPDAVGESIQDTLADLANYADLTTLAFRDKSEVVEEHKTALDRVTEDAKYQVAQYSHVIEFPAADIPAAPIDNDSPLRLHAIPVIPTPKEDPEPSSILARLFSKN
jgi:hypothetical protein